MPEPPMPSPSNPEFDPAQKPAFAEPENEDKCKPLSDFIAELEEIVKKGKPA